MVSDNIEIAVVRMLDINNDLLAQKRECHAVQPLNLGLSVIR